MSNAGRIPQKPIIITTAAGTFEVKDLQSAMPEGVDLEALINGAGEEALEGISDGQQNKALKQAAKQISQKNGSCAGGAGGSGGSSGASGSGGGSPASGNSLSQPSRIGGDTKANTAELMKLLDAMKAGGGGGFFEDRVFGLMIAVVAQMQKQVEQRLNKLQQQSAAAAGDGGGGGGGGGGEAGGAEGGGGSESRNIEFEKIKNDIQKLSQMQQAMSSVLNTFNELAMSAIRHIKAG